MKSQAFTHYTDQLLTSAGLVIFFVFFVGVVFWVYRKGSKEVYNHLDKLPLNDGE